MCETIPLLTGKPSLFTKNRSNFVDIVTSPGIIPQINNAKSINDNTTVARNPFQENSLFLKYQIRNMAGNVSRFSRWTPIESPIR